jgi:starch phosphorylase
MKVTNRMPKSNLLIRFADLKTYREAHPCLPELYPDKEAWSKKAVLNTAASRKFSSDRGISGYAKEIGHTEPFAPVSQDGLR